MNSGPPRLDRWLESAGDCLNPLLVRETRQWLKSRSFLITFLLLLGICWFAAMFEATVPRAFTGLFFDGPPAHFRPDARSLFAFYFLLLTLIIFVTVPVTAFFNYSREYASDAIEILRVTPLKSKQIAWGKLQTALLQMGLYFAAVAPFISFTYLLQGIGLLSILFSLMLISIGGTALAVLGLALGSFSRSTGWQVFNMLLLVAGTGIALLIFHSFGMAFSQRGDMTSLMGGTFCLTVFCVTVMAIGMAVTVSNVRPQAGFTRVTFVNFKRLLQIAETGRAFAAILRNEFPIAGSPRNWAPEASAAFPEIHQNAMRLALELERTLFDARPSYGDRNRYLTYPLAREPLRNLLQSFDLILFELWWNDLSVGLLHPRGCRILADGTPVVSEITASLLDSLESSAASIRQFCLDNPDVEQRKPGSMTGESLPEIDIRSRNFLGEITSP